MLSAGCRVWVNIKNWRGRSNANTYFAPFALPFSYLELFLLLFAAEDDVPSPHEISEARAEKRPGDRAYQGRNARVLRDVN